MGFLFAAATGPVTSIEGFHMDAATPPGPAPVRLDRTGDFMLEYTCGSEHDPANPYGRCVLTLYADGRLTLDNRVRGQNRSWGATVEPGVVDRLVALLDAAGFPAVPLHPVAPGATRVLLVRSGGTWTRTPVTGFHEARRMPGYKEVYHLLDSLVACASLGALTIVQDVLPDLVRDVVVGRGASFDPEAAATSRPDRAR